MARKRRELVSERESKYRLAVAGMGPNADDVAMQCARLLVSMEDATARDEREACAAWLESAGHRSLAQAVRGRPWAT